VVVVACFFQKPAPEYYEEANVLLGTKYLGVASQPELVIVGSSMGAKINGDGLPGAFNLSFTGRGALDGLEIIKHRKSRPHAILIEINTLFRSGDLDFTNKVTSPIGRYLNRGTHEMPVNYIVEFSAGVMRRLSTPGSVSAPSQSVTSNESNLRVTTRDAIGLEQAKTDGQSADEAQIRQHAAFDKVTAQNIAEWQTLPEYYHLDENLDLLNSKAKALAAEDVVVILIEMPCDSRIYNSPRFQRIREGISKRDSLAKLPLIRVDDFKQYQSNDGLHLVQKSSRDFTEYLAAELNRLLLQQ
jgi:hypothetical protein